MLVSLRDPDDPMAAQELRCFQRVTGLAGLALLHAVDRPEAARLRNADLVLFGGSGLYSVLDDAPWVRHSLDLLVAVAESGVPAWASCFGYQGLVLAMGGRVVRDEARVRLGPDDVLLTPEGHADPLLGPLGPGFRAMFGHNDHVESLPAGVLPLAVGLDGRVEALHVAGTRFWGAQFHPELDQQSILERWRHYRDHYAPDRAAEVERTLSAGPDTVEVAGVLRRLVELAGAG